MSRKKCRRKVWNLVDPVQHAILGATITDEASLNKLRLSELSAVDAFVRGVATKQDWKTVADMLNLTETMAHDGIGAEALDTCDRVTHALQQAHRRYHQHGRMGLSGPEIVALRELFDCHDQQRKLVSRSVYEQAIVKTRNRINSAHPSVKVLIDQPT